MYSLEKNLLTDEKVLYKTHQHSVVYGPTLIWLLFAFFLYLRFPQLHFLSLVSFILAIASLMSALIIDKTSLFVLTNKRAIFCTGVIKRRSLILPPDQISLIDVRQSMLGSLFGFGSIFMATPDGARFKFPYLKSPLKLRRLIQEQALNYK